MRAYLITYYPWFRIILHNLRRPLCGVPHWVLEDIEGKVETSSDVDILCRGLHPWKSGHKAHILIIVIIVYAVCLIGVILFNVQNDPLL